MLAEGLRVHRWTIGETERIQMAVSVVSSVQSLCSLGYMGRHRIFCILTVEMKLRGVFYPVMLRFSILFDFVLYI